MRLRLLALITCLAALTGLPATASAAYAPKLTAMVTPPKAEAPVAVTTTLSQKAFETNSKSVLVLFPKEMGVNFNSAANPCTNAQENVRMCPARSLLGKASATVQAPVGELTGTVNLGETDGKGRIKLIVFLESSNALVGKQKPIEGFVTLTQNGPLTAFGGPGDAPLPDIPGGLTIQRFTLALDGPPNTLIKNPDHCGTFPLKASFTSQKGDTATSETSFSVTDCPKPAPDPGPTPDPRPKPNVAPKLTHAAVLSGARIRFTLSERARVSVRVNLGRKVVKRFTRAARRGKNTFHRLQLGRKAKKGRYTVTLQATDGGRKRSKTVVLHFRRR